MSERWREKETETATGSVTPQKEVELESKRKWDVRIYRGLKLDERRQEERRASFDKKCMWKED